MPSIRMDGQISGLSVMTNGTFAHLVVGETVHHDVFCIPNTTLMKKQIITSFIHDGKRHRVETVQLPAEQTLTLREQMDLLIDACPLLKELTPSIWVPGIEETTHILVRDENNQLRYQHA